MKKCIVDFSVSNQPQFVDLTNAEIKEKEEREAAAGTDEERALQALRESRDAKLTETDWTQGADVPDSIKSAFVSYRQKLRDITKTYSDLRTVEWPEHPTNNKVRE